MREGERTQVPLRLRRKYLLCVCVSVMCATSISTNAPNNKTISCLTEALALAGARVWQDGFAAVVCFGGAYAVPISPNHTALTHATRVTSSNGNKLPNYTPKWRRVFAV